MNKLRNFRVQARHAPPSLRRLVAPMVFAVALVALSGVPMFVAASGSSLALEPAARPAPGTAQETLQRYIDEAWNAGDMIALSELLTVDHVCYEPGILDGEVGIGHMAEMIRNFRTAFPDWQFEVTKLAEAEDGIRAQLVGRGTQSGPFVYSPDLTVEPGGRHITLDVVLDAKLKAGKISEQLFDFDTADLLGQMQADLAVRTYLTEQRNLEVAREYWEAFMDPTNLEVFERVYAPGIIWHMGSRRTFTAPRSDQIEWHQNFVAAFDTLHGEIDQIKASGNFVTAHLVVRGTLTQAYPSPVLNREVALLRPDQKDVTFSWLTLVQLRDGKIFEAWVYEDLPFAY